MNNHDLFISGQCGTGKHVLLRNKPKENAFFTQIGCISEFLNPIDFSNPRTSCILSRTSRLTIKTIDMTTIIVINLPTASNRSLEVRRNDLLGISEYVSPHK